MDDADLEDDGDERRKGGEGVQMAEREAISVSIPELLVCIVSGPASRNGSKGS